MTIDFAKYSKAIAAAVAAISTVVIPALADKNVSMTEGLAIAGAIAGVLAVFGVTNNRFGVVKKRKS